MTLTRCFWRCFLAVLSQADHCSRARFHAPARICSRLQNCDALALGGAFLLLLCGISLSFPMGSKAPLVEICSPGSSDHRHSSHRTPLLVCGWSLAPLPGLSFTRFDRSDL